VWQAVRPRVLGIEAWPVIAPGTSWKDGVCAALGWPSDTGLAWRRMGARFALKTLVTTAALSALVAVLPQWIELGRIEPAVAAILFGLLFGIAGLAAIRHGGSFGGLSVLWIELQDRTGFPAGHAQLLSDVVIFGLAALVLPFDTLGYSFLGAAVFSLFLAVNHRRDRYVAV
jgi:uncharacterized membrane-anchored protein YitT (DUF2179 family)